MEKEEEMRYLVCACVLAMLAFQYSYCSCFFYTAGRDTNESQEILSHWLDRIMRTAQASSAGGSGKDSRMYNKQLSHDSGKRIKFLWDKVPRNDFRNFIELLHGISKPWQELSSIRIMSELVVEGGKTKLAYFNIGPFLYYNINQ